MKRIFFVIVVFTFCLTGPVFAGVSLTYYIFWGPFKIGVAKIQIEENYYKAITYTVGLGNFFYPY